MAAGRNSRRANGEGSLVLRKDGRWMGRYWVTLPDGMRKQQCVISKNKAKVIETMRAEMASADKGSPVLRAKRSTGEFLVYWLREIDLHQVRPTTLQLHVHIVQKYLLPRVGKIPLTQLRPEHVRAMLNRMQAGGCGARTMQQARNVLSAALRDAMKLEYITRNAARLVDLPKYTASERQVWTKEQAAHFFETIKDHDRYPMFLLLLCCGLRRGELLGLRWQDVDFENEIIRIRQSLRYLNGKPCIGPLKTKTSRRDLPMLTVIKDALLRHRQASKAYSDDLVFHSRTGNPAYPNTIRKTFQRLALRAGLPPITLHEARHTAATLLAEAWASPKETQKILGHSSITTTLQIYTHSRLQREASALEALMQGIV